MAAGFRSTPQELVLVVHAKKMLGGSFFACFCQSFVYTPTQLLKHTSLSIAPIGYTGLPGFFSHEHLEVMQQ